MLGEFRAASSLKGRGQTVVETVMMLLILLLLFFVIAEFSRAWYLKNSLNNAVRKAVREAVVLTPALLGVPPDIINAPCPSGNEVVNSVCTSPGVPNRSTTLVSVIANDIAAPAGVTTGDIIEVRVRAAFNTVVPALLPFAPKSAVSSASMRYE